MEYASAYTMLIILFFWGESAVFSSEQRYNLLIKARMC